MNAQAIVNVLLEDGEDVDLNVQQFVRGALGFSTILPPREKHWERHAGTEIYEKDFDWEPGHAQLIVEVHEYLRTHNNRPDSAHVTFEFHAAHAHILVTSCNVYDLRKNPNTLSKCVQVITQVIDSVKAAHEEWAKTAPRDPNAITAQHTSVLVATVKGILQEAVTSLEEIGNPSMRPWRTTHPTTKLPTSYGGP